MNSYFNILIEIGRNNTLPSEEELANMGLSMRIMLPKGWESFSDDDILLLFRGLVILEEYWFCTEGHIGSTTDTKFVYREILSRELDPDYTLGNWAFHYSSNPYVPMDSGNRHGAKTIQELIDWRNAFYERSKKK